MRIHEIRAVGLRGERPEAGWSDELEQNECVHTLIAVITDKGLTGLGLTLNMDTVEQYSRGESLLV